MKITKQKCKVKQLRQIKSSVKTTVKDLEERLISLHQQITITEKNIEIAKAQVCELDRYKGLWRLVEPSLLKPNTSYAIRVLCEDNTLMDTEYFAIWDGKAWLNEFGSAMYTGIADDQAYTVLTLT